MLVINALVSFSLRFDSAAAKASFCITTSSMGNSLRTTASKKMLLTYKLFLVKAERNVKIIVEVNEMTYHAPIAE